MRLVTVLVLVGAASFIFLAGCNNPQQPKTTTQPVAYQEAPTDDLANTAPPGPGASNIGPSTEPPPIPGGDTSGRTYTVKAGDKGLMNIARTQLGNAHRWKEIAALNPEIQPPAYSLKVGQVIKMPAK